jgi:hypothetical protein
MEKIKEEEALWNAFGTGIIVGAIATLLVISIFVCLS